MRILVIIPAYNEQGVIYNVVKAVAGAGYDVLAVDDGSADATGEEAAKAGAWVVRHAVNRGYGAALVTGNDWAVQQGYDIAVHFDADGQHEVGDIAKLTKPFLSGQVDVVLGSRFKSDANDTNDMRMIRMKIPMVRKLLLRTAVLFTWFVSGLKLTDAHNGLRALSRAALEKIDCRQDGMSYASEVIDQIAENNLRFREVPVTVKYTEYSVGKGESNIRKILLGMRFLWGKVIK